MALVLDLDDYKAPTLEVNFGYKQVSAKIDDEMTRNMASAVTKASKLLTDADGLTDAKLAEMSTQEASDKLSSVLAEARDILEDAIDNLFNEKGLGAELYDKLGQSTDSLATVVLKIRREVEAKQKQLDDQKMNRYTRRSKKRK